MGKLRVVGKGRARWRASVHEGEQHILGYLPILYILPDTNGPLPREDLVRRRRLEALRFHSPFAQRRRLCVSRSITGRRARCLDTKDARVQSESYALHCH
jgi:hypothetical protein